MIIFSILAIKAGIVASLVRCSCLQLDNQSDCLEAGCFWRNQVCIQISCENRVTESECKQTTLTEDADPNCHWYQNLCYDVDSICSQPACSNTRFCLKVDTSCLIAGPYRRPVCSELGTAGDCIDKQVAMERYCQWVHSENKCIEVNMDTQCSGITSQIPCEALSCIWEATEKKCRNKACSFFKPKEKCLWAIGADRKFTTCIWNNERDFCFESGESQSTEQFTNKTRCSLDSSFVYYKSGNQCVICGSQPNAWSPLLCTAFALLFCFLF